MSDGIGIDTSAVDKMVAEFDFDPEEEYFATDEAVATARKCLEVFASYPETNFRIKGLSLTKATASGRRGVLLSWGETFLEGKLLVNIGPSGDLAEIAWFWEDKNNSAKKEGFGIPDQAVVKEVFRE